MTDGTLIYWVEDDDKLVNGVRVCAGNFGTVNPEVHYLYLLGDAHAQTIALEALKRTIDKKLGELYTELQQDRGTVKIVPEGGLLYGKRIPQVREASDSVRVGSLQEGQRDVEGGFGMDPLPKRHWRDDPHQQG